MAAYADANIRKPMYRRVEAPADGFLKIVPSTGCLFHNYEIYNGVEYDIKYRFGQRNELEPYEKDVRNALNRVLRHHAGKVMDKVNLGLVCDDAGWVPIDDLLKYENVWRQDSSRTPHTFLASRGRINDKRAWDKQEAGYRMSIVSCSGSCSTAPDMGVESVNKSLPSTRTSTGTVRRAEQTTSIEARKFQRKGYSCTRWPFEHQQVTSLAWSMTSL